MMHKDTIKKLLSALENTEVLLLYVDADDKAEKVGAMGTLVAPKVGLQSVLDKETGRPLLEFYSVDVRSISILRHSAVSILTLKDPETLGVE
jgi:hypothetical protein